MDNLHLSSQEIWKDIEGYDGLYLVSDLGRIKSLLNRRNVAERILKQSLTASGYYGVTLCKGGKHSTKHIHRLVMSAFEGSSDLDVNHKDGNKANNRFNNLEYCSKKFNSQHAIATGLHNPNTYEIATKQRKVVQQIDIATGEVVNEFESAHSAAKITGFNRGNISSCCRGVKPHAAGFLWKYVD